LKRGRLPTGSATEKKEGLREKKFGEEKKPQKKEKGGSLKEEKVRKRERSSSSGGGARGACENSYHMFRRDLAGKGKKLGGAWEAKFGLR